MPTPNITEPSSATTLSPASVHIDEQSAESWAGVLSQFRDANLYQTWSYGSVRWGERKLSHLVLRRHGRIVAAAQLRIARVPLLPAGIAYLRWGPLCEPWDHPMEPSLCGEMLGALRREYVEKRGLTLQIIPNAFRDTERAALLAAEFHRLGFAADPGLGEYRTIVVDLSAAPGVIRKRLDGKWRNQLNAAERNGLQVESSASPAAYREFLSLYRTMWEKKRFETSVDVDEFNRIQNELSAGERMQVFLARKDGQPVAALVCARIGDTVLYVLGATNDAARTAKAAYLLQWHSMLWSRQQGAYLYDLGGIDPDANPGGYHFKSGFGGRDVTHLAPHVLRGNWLSGSISAMAGRRRRHGAVATIQLERAQTS